MGCSQGKTTKTSGVRETATSAKPMPTLWVTSSSQKFEIGVEYPDMEDGAVAPANNMQGKSANLKQADESVTSPHRAVFLKDWPLRWKALRLFAMADKGPEGLLDASELAGDGSDKAFSEMLQDALDGDVARLRSQAEWLESMKKMVLRDVVQAALFFDLCEEHIAEQKERWPLRDEALQIFSMADRDGDGQLDMTELTEVRQSDEFARAMLDATDVDKNGTISKGEWLAYVKRLADHNQKSAAAVLALYRKHLSNSSNTAEAYLAAKNAMDVLVDDSAVGSPQRWWACY